MISIKTISNNVINKKPQKGTVMNVKYCLVILIMLSVAGISGCVRHKTKAVDSSHVEVIYVEESHRNENDHHSLPVSKKDETTQIFRKGITSEKDKTTVTKEKSSSGYAIDRLAWLADLLKHLRTLPRPACIGPRGCSLSIPEDSPCRKPVEQKPEPVVDGVIPGDALGIWIVGYRLMCSSCYLGGTGYLAIVQVTDNREPHIIDSIELKKSFDDELPNPIMISHEDFDEDGKPEISVYYQNVSEGKKKCTGLHDASAYLLAARISSGKLHVLFHEQIRNKPLDKGRPFSSEYRFEDVSNDGYSDLIITKTVEADVLCPENKCEKKGLNGDHTVQTVYRYEEESRDFNSKPFRGYALSKNGDVDCEIPLPETPFAVIAGIFPGGEISDEMESEAIRLRQAGFKRTCLYNGDDYEGLKNKSISLIASAHASRSEADKEATELRKSGFRPFVKRLF